jgi:hypothetical protein
MENVSWDVLGACETPAVGSQRVKGWRAAAEETEILRPAKQGAGSQDDKGCCARSQSIERTPRVARRQCKDGILRLRSG